VSTVAGTGTAGFSGDGGPASAAQLGAPLAVSVTPDGGYLIVDQGNSRIRRVLPDGTIITIAGTTQGFGGDGGPATMAQMSAPTAALMAGDGSVLIADGNNNRVRRIAPDGTITTVAGTGAATFGGDGGQATLAQISFPADLALQADGGYLIADNDNNRIRRVAPNGVITTVAGIGSPGFSGDGGPATSAQLNDPIGLAAASDGGFVIVDTNNHRVRRVAPDGTITTLAGLGFAGFQGDDGPGTAAALNTPNGVASAPDASVLIADRLNHRIRRVAPDGTITTAVGTGTAGFNGDGGLGPATQLNNPYDATFTVSGDYLIADTHNHRIRLVDAGAATPSALALDPASADRTPGDANVVTATARNDDGTPTANRTIRWSIAGPHAGAGTVTTDAAGVARIAWDGVREGTDELSAFVDTDGNSTSDAGEPTARATVRWALPAPVQGRRVNLEPVSGIVKIRIVRRAKGVDAAGSSFTTLDAATQVPLTTIVDVRKGRVRQTMASDQSGGIQKGEFYGGMYTTRQSTTSTRPVAELRLNQTLTCQPNTRGRITASAARSRRLWGNAQGRFRTRGRNSAATVRGTLWLTKDSCNSTTTVVREGTVVVRDFARRKNVTVKKGRSYTAHARR
jgi:hypothetical protein